MTAWNGEEDGYVTADKDTWVDAPKESKEEYDYLKDAPLTEELVKGAVEALNYAAWMVDRRCYPSDVADRLREEARAIKAEWERRQHEEVSR